ncbi:MAG: 2-deoxyribose-5-phosphate aldolase [Christensenellales bacterium]|jgi:deoxyribose-phosphate aldolase
MVMNYGAARGGNWDVVEEAHAKGVGVKVIFETSQLDDAQIRKGTEVCIAAGADFVKTSTGFNGDSATVESVKAMIETSKGRIKVKPSGGIRSFKTAKMYVDMGADRLGVGYTSCKPICEDGEYLSGELLSP